MIARDVSTFLRWAGVLVTRLRPGAPMPDLPLAWQRAQRTIAARLALGAVREGLTAGSRRGDALVLDDGPELPLARVGELELHEPELGGPRHPWLEDPAVLWQQLGRDQPPAVRERVAAELADSAFNLGLAVLAEWLRPAWAAEHPDDPRALDSEHWVTEGHPWHPMTKTRLGLGLAEHAQLAPELLARTPLRAIDVDAELVQATPQLTEHLEPWLGRAPSGSVRLPVHGRQLPRLARAFSDRWGTALRPAPWRDQARSLLSMRTVVTEPPLLGPLHLKLALDVHTTSARRVVSPMSVLNGPRVSALLAEIQRRDPVCARLRVVPETMTGGLQQERVGPRARELGIIVRDGRDFLGTDGRPAWVCAGLGRPAPLDGRSGVERLAEGFEGSPRQRAAAMLERYVEALVPPVLRFAVHGVALEAHLQNTLVLARDGRPEGFVIRDLGGIRLHRPRLRAAGHAPSLHPDSFIETDDLEELRTKVSHTLLHAHLHTLLGWVEAILGLPSAEGWALVRRSIDTQLERWAEEPGLRNACEGDRRALLAPRVRAKALLTMRIDDRSSDYAYIDVDNPLARAAAQG
ncbi:MAG: hypothetical protein H6712_00415 [Myxococcales bacterium]|nr:hypothetical protein [Myxococcales bacterium]MCB9712288.1 hypothetical protein [Myxococcales bacterium]